ncbi:hypothetical protein F5888DRAFT_181617 [Russula emetica]|nr:hypothetical protein F5888DRAFT_181617 [Russula emetica]
MMVFDSNSGTPASPSDPECGPVITSPINTGSRTLYHSGDRYWHSSEHYLTLAAEMSPFFVGPTARCRFPVRVPSAAFGPPKPTEPFLSVTKEMAKRSLLFLENHKGVIGMFRESLDFAWPEVEPAMKQDIARIGRERWYSSNTDSDQQVKIVLREGHWEGELVTEAASYGVTFCDSLRIISSHDNHDSYDNIVSPADSPLIPA